MTSEFTALKRGTALKGTALLYCAGPRLLFVARSDCQAAVGGCFLSSNVGGLAARFPACALFLVAVIFIFVPLFLFPPVFPPWVLLIFIVRLEGRTYCSLSLCLPVVGTYSSVRTCAYRADKYFWSFNEWNVSSVCVLIQ